jgi:hypothetical protein
VAARANFRRDQVARAQARAGRERPKRPRDSAHCLPTLVILERAFVKSYPPGGDMKAAQKRKPRLPTTSPLRHNGSCESHVLSSSMD